MAGCNCGKGSAKPLGSNGGKSQQQVQREGAKQSFVLQTRDGRTQTFDRKLDANAARVRAGGGTIRPL